MFTVTALGHQGWLLGTARTHVLIDPVLTPRFTRLPLCAPEVFPPRRVELAGFPPIDAVLISHEHPDHLDFVSLQHLDRRVPVYLSAHASDAARRMIASLGFEVVPLSPGRPITIGEIDVLPFAPYVIGEPGENEVDAVPLLARDRAGHGNFFTSVDIVQVPEMAQEVRRHVDRPGVWTHANNTFDQGTYLEWVARPEDAVDEAVRALAPRYVSLFEGWGHPEITLVNGDGVTLGGDLAAQNPHVFPVVGEALAARLGAALPGHVFRAVKPGTTVEMRDGELARVHDDLPFLTTDDGAAWPQRGGAPYPGGTRPDFAPGTGRRALREGERAALERALADFGRFLFARASYRGIYRLMAERDHAPALEQTLALALREGEAGRAEVWEYRPQRCAFVRVSCDDPRARYVAGGEFWASDVLAALTFQASADDLFHFGRKRLWNAAPGVFRCDLDVELQLFAYAHRAPDAVEALYRRTVAPDVPVGLRAPAERAAPGTLVRPRRAPNLRPVPAALRTKASLSAGYAAAPSQAPIPSVPETTVARLGAAVLEASGGTWTLGEVSRTDGVLRAALALPGGAIVVLEVAPSSGVQRYYKRVGALAFTYGPGSLGGAPLAVLGRIIEAFAVALPAAEAAQVA